MAEEEPKEKNADEVEEEPPVTEQPKKAEKKPHKVDSKWHRFVNWYKTDKKKSIPLTILAVLLLMAALPITRYHAAGLVLKKDFTMQVNDSVTNTPVSGADVQIGTIHLLTDAKGKATFHHIAVGQYTALIAKKYYDDRRVSVVVPIMEQKTTPQVAFTALGRQAKIVVINSINAGKVTGAVLRIGSSLSATDEQGTATIVLPTGVSSVKAVISAKDYNNSEVTVQVSNSEVKENDFKLTPAGKVYFLSKLSGKIDVVKTNLDGTERATVLAGTGFEEDRGTVMLASRDWKYLALLAKRDNGNPKLYQINTTDDSLTVMDQGNVTFTPVGWSDDNFVYKIEHNDYQQWQAKRQIIKSFSAANKQNTILDQTKAEGTNYYDGLYESYGSIYQIGKNVVFDKTWSWGYSIDPSKLNGKANAIYSINAGGSGFQTLKSFDFSIQDTLISSVPYEAGQIYYSVTPLSSANPKPTYYIYNNGKVGAANKDLTNEFNEYTSSPTTYLLSPSGSGTFWADVRDGKKVLFVGDADGENGKQIAPLSEYQNYGWYTDDYLLVSKNSSELYILPKEGAKKDSDAIKISDYHKPTQTFNGYGGGYGGI